MEYPKVIVSTSDKNKLEMNKDRICAPCNDELNLTVTEEGNLNRLGYNLKSKTRLEEDGEEYRLVEDNEGWICLIKIKK
jgi:hypothetical protein